MWLLGTETSQRQLLLFEAIAVDDGRDTSGFREILLLKAFVLFEQVEDLNKQLLGDIEILGE